MRAQKRVLIVDDSLLSCQMLAKLITADPQLMVAGVAHNGQEAVQMIPQLAPDIIVMDFIMPVMNGLEATKQIMAYAPTPILIMSSGLVERGRELPFEALAYGALDVIDKNNICGIPGAGAGAIDLAAHLKVLSTARVMTHPLAKFERLGQDKTLDKKLFASGEYVVAMAASTGGPQAVLSVLKKFPAEFSCGLVLVQHIAIGFTQSFVDWMDRECRLKVKLAVHGECLQAGVAYVAPAQCQMRVASGGVIHLTDEPPCLGHKPSATVLFESVAASYGARAIGVILTGMGVDGAAGLVKLHAASGKVIAQDEATSAVFGMPKAAIELNAVDWVLPLDRIAAQVMKSVALFAEVRR